MSNNVLKRSQIIVVVIIIVGAVMVISLTLATLMFAELKNQRNLTYSLAAQYAAETGVELAINNIRQGLSPGERIPTPLSNKATIIYNYGDLTADGTRVITSTGTMFGVKRSYQVEVHNDNFNGFLRPETWREVSP